MAKQSVPKAGVTKVRFLMLEAEGSESDLSQIFAAIQSAVKPTTQIIQQRLAPSNSATFIEQASTDVEDADDDFSPEPDEVATTTPKRTPSVRVRKPTTPDVLEFDFLSELSLQDFADRHVDVDNEPDRYLIIAAWFKDHRDVSAVTTSHIYTAYRTLEWPAGIEDFGWPFRYLKKQKFLGSTTRGEFEINHLGLAKAKKLSKTA
ncbi:hypothetical protein E5673_07840 [Sphingomonas sp. PAMC26645]|uniref:hypothetical protein n=1 Tax=Sphingomonas sp. PAMC26645 TaxID=2565555 RepID=UPI00109DC881|nr:hypothetical protein [Sphingomonas sp. PAMC26645]QCB42146.1 hypothetical protein E5673_07840 [Sphingomonas sp. PAMC26645]